MNEQQLKEIAATFPYPPTPDLVAGIRHKLAPPAQPRRKLVGQQRLAWALLLFLALLAISLTVPQVRAAVLRIFRVGAVTIFVPGEPESTAVSTTTPISRVTPTTPPQATRIQDVLLSPAGEMSLAELRTQVDKELYIPEGWGPPDRIYYQTRDWPGVVIFVWLEPGSEDEVRLSLYQILTPNFAYKGAESFQEVTWQGQRAFWLEGGHWLQLQDGTVQPWLFVEGGVLVWWSKEAGVTFRLESGLSLAEAKEIAESLIILPKEE